MGYLIRGLAEQRLIVKVKRVCHFHDWGVSFISFLQLSKQFQLYEHCHAADAAVIQGDAPVIEDGDDEEPAEPARDDGSDQIDPAGGTGDDQTAAVPAVQAEGRLVPAGGENAVSWSMRQEIAEPVMAAVGSTPFHMRMDGMLLEQVEVQKPGARNLSWKVRYPAWLQLVSFRVQYFAEQLLREWGQELRDHHQHLRRYWGV